VAWYADRLDASRQEFGCPIAPTVLEAANDSEPIAAAANAVFESWITRLADALRARGVSCQQARRCAATVVAGIEGALVLSRAARCAQLLRDIGAELANTLDAAVAAASTTDASRRR
jgi:TetR/AcrR family transcriptional repressor of lmrAB and yxaGH operons